VYYPTLAYLIGKGLIQVDASNRTERFELTEQGLELAKELGGSEEFSDLTLRAKTVYKLFCKMNGTKIKDFIYAHFPEVAGETSGKAL
jgi:DNA-binding PadR family transcriptional regulator